MKREEANFIVGTKSGEISSFQALTGPVDNPVVRFKTVVGGGSFTNGETMQVGLFDKFIDELEDSKYTPALGVYSMKGLVGHENGHVWFTSFKEFKKFREKMIPKFEAEGIDSRLATKVSSHMFNITEDGRIEHRMVNKFPGLINYFRYNNGTIWGWDPEKMPVELDDNGDNKREFDNFMRCCICYSVVGLRPRWYKDAKGTEMRDEFEKLVDIIEDSIVAPSCKANCDNTEKLFDTCWDYIIKLLKRLQEDEEEMENYINNGGEAGAGGAGDFGEGIEGEADGTSEGEGDSSARLGGGKANSTGDNTSAGQHDTRGQEQEVGAYEETYDMSTETGSAGGSGEGCTHDGGGSTKVIKSKEGHVTKMPEEIIAEVEKEATVAAAKEEATSASSSETRKKSSTESSTMTKEEVSKMIGAVGYDKEYVRKYREERNSYRMIPLPDHLRPQATRFKRKVQRCFKEKNTKITKMTSGKLDMRLLHKVGMDEYNIFTKDLNKSNVDAVVEICWDGSGSMCGGKQTYSGEACAIIEEGLKGLIPLKIINFSVDWSHQEVVHYLVKDFDEKNRSINYSMSYTKSKGFNGGNKDGYDIRVCTEDLMKRPEKDKILIVMSDGLPSDYNSINPEDDVKDAVKAARRKGIIVIPIFFGDEHFRNSAYSTYEYMYEKFIINSAPAELPERLVKLFEKLVLR